MKGKDRVYALYRLSGQEVRKMCDLIETYYLSCEEITELENALGNVDERTRNFINKYVDIYDDSIERCLENPNKTAANFLRYYLKNKRLPFIKKEFEI
jgi:hypothetical protein